MPPRIPLAVILGVSMVLADTGCSARAHPAAATARHDATPNTRNSTANTVTAPFTEHITDPQGCKVHFLPTWTQSRTPWSNA
jgi:hypothetical protein